MNDIIIGRTTPNIRHLIKGILLCEMLNAHLRNKIEKNRDKALEIIYEIEMISQSSNSDDDEIEINEFRNLLS